MKILVLRMRIIHIIILLGFFFLWRFSMTMFIKKDQILYDSINIFHNTNTKDRF